MEDREELVECGVNIFFEFFDSGVSNVRKPFVAEEMRVGDVEGERQACGLASLLASRMDRVSSRCFPMRKICPRVGREPVINGVRGRKIEAYRNEKLTRFLGKLEIAQEENCFYRIPRGVG